MEIISIEKKTFEELVSRLSNEVITHKHEWVRGLFSELDRITKDAATNKLFQ